MSWAVRYTAAAKHDFRIIYESIAYDLLAAEAAAKQTQRIMKRIHMLNEMPLRHRLYEDEPWRSQGVRFFPVDHYLIFYLPDEIEKTVSIIRIMYSGNDIHKQLQKVNMED